MESDDKYQIVITWSDVVIDVRKWKKSTKNNAAWENHKKSWASAHRPTVQGLVVSK